MFNPLISLVAGAGKIIIDDIFETLEPTTDKHREFAFKHGGEVHPFDLIKNLDLEMLGIYIALLQRKWEKEFTERFGVDYLKGRGCVQCEGHFKDEDIPHNFWKYFGVPMHLRCLENWIYKNLNSRNEKDIRYLARVWGGIYHGSTRGAYNPDEMHILEHFNLLKQI